MRFDELTITLPDDEVRIPFHPRLTILGGLGEAERAELIDTVLGALAGGAATAALHGTDATGTGVVISGGPGGVEARTEDGAAVPAPVGSMARTGAALRGLLVMSPPAPPARRREDEPAELREARDALEELTVELEEATRAHAGRAAAVERVEELETQIQAARDGAARRRYAELLADIERVEDEAAALRADSATVEADCVLLQAGPRALTLGEAWREALARRHALAERAGQHHDPDRLELLAAIPDEAPADLPEMLERLQRATARHRELEDRLQQLAVASLPEPSHPAVAELGVIDPAVLSEARQALARATSELHHAQIAVGGLEVDGGSPAHLISEIEDAHTRTEIAERAAASMRPRAIAGLAGAIVLAGMGVAVHVLLIPAAVAVATVTVLLAGRPQLAARQAAAVERAVLDEAGAPSYLAFHIRRMEATVDRGVRTRVEDTARAHRDALKGWTALVGPATTVELADELAEEVLAYNQALRDLGGAADEIEQLRSLLTDEARPELNAAMDAVAEACRPYGVDPAAVLAGGGTLDDAVLAGRAARAQLALDQAEAEEHGAAAALDAALAPLVPSGRAADRADRLAGLASAIEAATTRTAARERARPSEEIERELGELRARAEELRRPEWTGVTAEEADAPDIAELERQRAEVARELGDGAPIDLTRLADRHAALQRRVAALEARLRETGTDGESSDDLHHRIAAFLTAASQAGPHKDPVPVVLDDVLAAAPPDRRWDLLDRLLRLSTDHQIVYLTDDAFVTAWARRHADEGSLRVLEAQPATSDA